MWKQRKRRGPGKRTKQDHAQAMRRLVDGEIRETMEALLQQIRTLRVQANQCITPNGHILPMALREETPIERHARHLLHQKAFDMERQPTAVMVGLLREE